ncbi:MAG: hypothetical protein C0444_02025 [Microbacterium sp.]|nr:hypothetical protein [Microbacterium sp.]MBA4346586.1 hypothetical protein [Microbacterium sp.]
MVTSGGLLASMGAVGAAPAFAADATNCDPGNTVDAATGTAGDIQTLLDANTAIVCLSGSFTLTAPLEFDHNLTLFGLTAGELDGNDLTRLVEGGAGTSLTVQNLSLVDGSAVRGGAIYVDGDLTVDNSTFTDNSADEDGGAIYVDTVTGDPTIIVTDSTFSGNATGPLIDGFDGYSGGAIYSDSTGTFTITGSEFTENSASFLGGAVFGYAVSTEESTLSSNSAGGGGALYATLMASIESTYSDNSAEYGGAVMALAYAASIGSTFVGNEASFAGGAIASGMGGGGGFGGYGSMQSLNSTFVDNTAVELGGAILADYGQVALSTFLNNEVDSSGEGNAIYLFADESEMEIAGNVFAGTNAAAQLGAEPAGIYSDLGGNVFSTALATETALAAPHPSTLFSRSVTSLFGPSPTLTANGGTTATIALVSGSPAIDAVPPATLAQIDLLPTSALASAAEALQSVSDFTAAATGAGLDQRNVERNGFADAGAFEFGDAELAATGSDATTNGWLAALAAMLLGSGVAAALVARRRSRAASRSYAP